MNLSVLEGCTAVLGGSFDPIHSGHLHIANQVLSLTKVACVLFVPSGNHHFKADKIVLNYAKRFMLVESVIASEPRFAISTADETGSGYTAHLMQKLFAESPQTRFVFIIGADNLAKLEKWYDFPWLAANLLFLILPRPGYEVQDINLHGINAIELPIVRSPISSTEIRRLIARNESIKGMVPEIVEEEIVRLYHS
ncbi:MAG: nicotinate (nicotinamide) nucleotide adenylyltransferase [Candidatus Cloacimonetes bacterium]|nr:nicotinate (nicotinamide) nucleotide adenylyltransferase [Candidatus Cloacimonadota bacterium]